jgi:hypothetical protein
MCLTASFFFTDWFTSKFRTIHPQRRFHGTNFGGLPWHGSLFENFFFFFLIVWLKLGRNFKKPNEEGRHEQVWGDKSLISNCLEDKYWQWKLPNPTSARISWLYDVACENYCLQCGPLLSHLLITIYANYYFPIRLIPLPPTLTPA